jgi:hypothetical protein
MRIPVVFLVLALTLSLLFLSFREQAPGTRCNCNPVDKGYRYAIKHDTDFTAYAERSSLISIANIRSWEKKYSVPLPIEKGRMKGTPEDTLYHLDCWLYKVKTSKDCDLHLQVGPKNELSPRVVAEITFLQCRLQDKFLAELAKRKFKLDRQNDGIPIEVTGLGFFDGNNRGRKDSKYEAGCTWELHPVKDVKFK